MAGGGGHGVSQVSGEEGEFVEILPSAPIRLCFLRSPPWLSWSPPLCVADF